MKPTLVLVFALFFSSACFAAKRIRNYHLQSFDLECNFNSSWFRDGVCNLTRYANGTGSVSASAFVYRAADGLFCRVQSHVLNDKKKYIPGLLASTLDVCAIGDGQENFWLERFFPKVVVLLKGVIRACPYEGHVGVENFLIDGSMLTKFLPAGSFRLDARVYNRQNETLFFVKSYAIIRK